MIHETLKHLAFSVIKRSALYTKYVHYLAIISVYLVC